MNKTSLFFLLLFTLILPSPAHSREIKSRYATLHYATKQLLSDFNDQIRLGRKLNFIARKKNIITLEDEVLAKIDTIIEKAEVILDMFPNNMHIRIELLETSKDVNRIYKQRYGKKAKHIAYYSLAEDTIYISVDDARLRVLAHEVGHAIVDHYFKVRPPYNIHELMAQFTEKHISD
jgi:hypothetical protein